MFNLTEPKDGFRSASGYLGSVRCLVLSDVSYSDECRTKKYFQYAENMFQLFFAILKFYSTKHLFNNDIANNCNNDDNNNYSFIC